MPDKIMKILEKRDFDKPFPIQMQAAFYGEEAVQLVDFFCSCQPPFSGDSCTDVWQGRHRPLIRAVVLLTLSRASLARCRPDGLWQNPRILAAADQVHLSSLAATMGMQVSDLVAGTSWTSQSLETVMAR